MFLGMVPGHFWHPPQSGGHLRRNEKGWYLPGYCKLLNASPMRGKQWLPSPPAASLNRDKSTSAALLWLLGCHFHTTYSQKPVTCLWRPSQAKVWKAKLDSEYFVRVPSCFYTEGCECLIGPWGLEPKATKCKLSSQPQRVCTKQRVIFVHRRTLLLYNSDNYSFNLMHPRIKEQRSIGSAGPI